MKFVKAQMCKLLLVMMLLIHLVHAAQAMKKILKLSYLGFGIAFKFIKKPNSKTRLIIYSLYFTVRKQSKIIEFEVAHVSFIALIVYIP